MPLIFRLLLCGILAILHSGYAPAYAEEYPFYEDSFSQLQAKAKAEKKPYFVYFNTGWCGLCKSIEKHTLSNADFQRYATQRYLAFEVNGESSVDDGIALAKQFGVELYPTIAIFSSEGNLLNRISGFKTPAELEKILRAYENIRKNDFGTVKPTPPVATPNPPAPTPTPVAVAPPKPTPPLPAPTSTPVAVAPPKPTPPLPAPTQPASPTLPAVNPAPPSANGMLPPALDAAGNGLFRMNIDRIPTEGFAIQLGVFGDYQNIIRETDKLAAQNHRNVLVQITKTGVSSTFRLMLGPFPTKELATAYVEALKKTENRQGVVIEISKLK